jgi:restriction system protein
MEEISSRMARRKRQSTAEDIMDAVARLPWWAGVGLAIVTYALFHWLAGRPQPAITDMNQVGSQFLPIAIRGAAMGLQFLVPMLCLFGTLGSLMRAKKRAGLVARVTQSASADVLNGMSWQEFELLVGIWR